ncbi:unnamed protein product [Polarella glacialis]|uniref:sn-1-specific diacylglycerol lipase n=1 Tax=Polarella glacialis TaxID=89957 RepID=A0A813LZX5_POLGL|nr:unnamed protein product [Polarella glacialis]
MECCGKTSATSSTWAGSPLRVRCSGALTPLPGPSRVAQLPSLRPWWAQKVGWCKGTMQEIRRVGSTQHPSESLGRIARAGAALLGRRRCWASRHACAALSGRTTALSLDALVAAKNSREEKMLTSLWASISLLVDLLRKRPIYESVALGSLVAWSRLRMAHFQAYLDLQQSLPQALAPEDKVRLCGLLYALPYAKAIYGEPMHRGHMDSVTTVTTGLLQRLRTPSYDPFLSPDARTNVSAMLALSGRSEADLLHVHFNTSALRPAHAVLLDHEVGAIVLAIRGTLSPHDALRDAMATEAMDEGVGHEDGGFHEGMLQAAKWVADVVLPVLDRANQEYPTYRLVITGHSLGAGVAAILTLLLDAQSRQVAAASSGAGDGIGSVTQGVARLSVPRIDCYAFACPGVVSAAVSSSPHALRCVTSVACRMDIIPRLCCRSIDELMTELSGKTAASSIAEAFGSVASSVKASFSSQAQALLRPAIVAQRGLAPGLAADGAAARESPWARHRTVGHCFWIPDPDQGVILRAEPKHFDRIMVNESMMADHLLSRYEIGLRLATVGLTAGLPALPS